MAVFAVSYDLRKQRNYQALYEILEGSGVRALESFWFVEANVGAPEVRNILRRHMDQDDGLFVSTIEPGPTWASYDLLPGALEWLKARRP